MPKPEPSLARRFPPSEPCSCAVCLGYCLRPGWWTVEEASRAASTGLAGRMMLEVAPERTFGVLSPAFRGCEGSFALQEFAERGCTFLKDGLCELHGTGMMPLECRFCHHSRVGQGPVCHAAIEQVWKHEPGRLLVLRWARKAGLDQQFSFYGLDALKRTSRR